MEKTNIKLSIVMLSYNHELYIRQALESVLKQPVNFQFEILLGDDASTDNTVKVVQEVMDEYPGIIKLYANKENVGATRNQHNLLINTQGEYITYLEGDDYWEITEELQKSIDFLDKHSEYIGIGRFNKNYSERLQKIISVNSSIPKKEWVADLDSWKKEKAFGACIYRNFYREKEDFSIIYKSTRDAGERTMGFLMMQRGNIYVTREAWEVKRCDRIQGASNYNSIYTPVARWLDPINEYKMIEEQYHVNLRRRRWHAMLNLYKACNREGKREVYTQVVSEYDKVDRMLLSLWIWTKKLQEVITKPFVMVVAKLRCIRRKNV